MSESPIPSRCSPSPQSGSAPTPRRALGALPVIVEAAALSGWVYAAATAGVREPASAPVGRGSASMAEDFLKPLAVR